MEGRKALLHLIAAREFQYSCKGRHGGTHSGIDAAEACSGSLFIHQMGRREGSYAGNGAMQERELCREGVGITLQGPAPEPTSITQAPDPWGPRTHAGDQIFKAQVWQVYVKPWWGHPLCLSLCLASLIMAIQDWTFSICLCYLNHQSHGWKSLCLCPRAELPEKNTTMWLA